MEGMEGAGEEAIDGVQDADIRGKERVPSPKPGSSNRQEMFMPGVEWAERSPQGFLDALVRRHENRGVVSEPPSSSASDINDGGNRVEELTLTTNTRSNLVAVDSSNSGREGMPNWNGQWQHLYHLGGGLGNGNLRMQNVSKEKEPVMSYVGGRDMGNTFPPEMWIERHTSKQLNQDCSQSFRQSISNNDNRSRSPSGNRTKLMSTSGFSQFFVKNSMKGKGIVCRNPERNVMEQNNEKAAYSNKVVSEPLPNLDTEVNHPSLHTAGMAGPDSVQDGINLRKWLKMGRTVNKAESLHIFRQIVELVDLAHSQQVVMQDVRPSSFKLLSSNQVKYVGTFGAKELTENVRNTNVPPSPYIPSGKRFSGEDSHPYNLVSKQQKVSHDVHLARQQLKTIAEYGYKPESDDMCNTGSQDSGYVSSQQHDLHLDSRHQSKSSILPISAPAQNQLMPVNFQLEEKWYISPEELNGRHPTFSSDIYSLGVLLFELFCCFESWEMHAAALLDLQHRILSPVFLSEFPKEAGFCLWLLHPEPSSRPSTREILQSDLIIKSEECPEKLLSPIDEDDAESELLLHFLLSLKEHKHKQASKLVEDIGCLEADIEEVEKRHLLRTTGVLSWKQDFSSPLVSSPSNTLSRMNHVAKTSQSRLTKNMSQLENAYFSTRSQIQHPDTDGAVRSDIDILKTRDRCLPVPNENEGQNVNQRHNDRLGCFFDGLCKYAHYSKFELRGTLRNGDLHSSANVICSLSFDRDEDYFAAAGVSKKIKIFEFQGLLNDSVDIHYPVVEMSNKSKLSCVSWNNYIKNYLASTDYDGVVQLWDANTGQGFSQYTDHIKRAWSVDFSPVDPTKFASGSDDFTVKLWSINEKKCTSTIQNTANVCCVQFSAESTHFLAFGSADFKTYCYDLRNTRHPWCTLTGHGKAVSYVKFVDPETLVSASTDNTLKLWDLNKTSSSGLSIDACSLTYRGHSNEKNFVGLSVSDGYIACGSESNEVYAYYRSLPMPLTSHKFGSIDPISGKETGDDNGQFVSSVCWKGKSDMIVVANSSGSIKVLQMV